MIQNLIESFKHANVLVIGDVMIDAYLNGKVSRISPEAPVPILNVKDRDYRLGGAANVASNLHKLGANPILCSVIGADEKGELFLSFLKKQSLENIGIIQSTERKTTIKYRIIGNRMQMLRIDDEDEFELTKNENENFIQNIERVFETYPIHAVIFEDYDKGVLNKSNIEHIISLAKKKNIPITSDPKRKNFHFYDGVSLFKPNLKELCDGLHLDPDFLDIKDVHKAAKKFSNLHKIDYVMVTLSEKGISIFDRKKDHFFHQPAYLREVSDVSGAGDTVISIATLCLAAQLSSTQIAQISNLAGGIVCQFVGVVPIDPELLANELEKIFPQNTKF
jgi:D-glycero-beta-D-manno-heptose-7-phosphate kinase